jgi:hypothetical protein
VRSTKRERRKGKDAGRFRKWSSDDATECGGSGAVAGRGGGWVWMCSAMDLLGFAIDVNSPAAVMGAGRVRTRQCLAAAAKGPAHGDTTRTAWTAARLVARDIR